MVPKEFRRSMCVIAGWVTLLEAVVWAAASIYSIGVYGCVWNFFGLKKGVSTWSMLYITYFMGECKGEVGAQELLYSLKPPTDPARYLQVWFWIFAIVSGAWIIACLLLVIAATGEVRGKQGARLYYPWIGLTSTLVVLDLAAAIYHLMDVFTTASPDDYAKFSGSTNWSTLTMGQSYDGITTWLPSLYMTLFFCKLLVLWILNIYFLYGVYKASEAVSLYKTKYLQTSLMINERKKTWKDQFYQGPDPLLFEEHPKNISANEIKGMRSKTPEAVHQESQPHGSESGPIRQDLSPVRYKTDEFGIPIEELNSVDLRDTSNNKNIENSTRSQYQPTGQIFDYTNRTVKPEPYSDRWKESAPPIAKGVQVPAELNKFEPFSYTAGDQPQLIRRPLSRSNSKGEYPPIPRPDYTVADRRSGSLEYVPNRFKVPSPKRPIQSQNSLNLESSAPRSPNSPKVGLMPLRKPLVHARSNPPIPEDPSIAPQEMCIPPQTVPSQQHSYYTSQTSQNSNYNINKLY